MEQRVERAAKALAVVGRVAIGRRESGKGRRESGQREEGVRAGYHGGLGRISRWVGHHGGLGRISRWVGQDITEGWAGCEVAPPLPRFGMNCGG